MKIVLAGATGLVGTTMMKVLEESDLQDIELIPTASEKSVGKKLTFRNQTVSVISMQDAVNSNADAALFSAGGSTSLEWAAKFAEKGTVVIDNSSAWRMHPDIKLIVPEVNGSELTEKDLIIANPNCSTIQLVVVLKALGDIFSLKRVIVSTYQSVTGTGVKAVAQMDNERKGIVGEMAYPHPIDKNILPHIDVFLENGYTKEEMKVILESRKILSLPELPITCTAVRVPVVGGHSESVNIEFEKSFELEEIKSILENTLGVILMDEPENNIYPMPIHSHEKNEIFVGRIRRDESKENTINCWIVADNLRKGAATNAVQILEIVSKLKGF